MKPKSWEWYYARTSLCDRLYEIAGREAVDRGNETGVIDKMTKKLLSGSLIRINSKDGRFEIFTAEGRKR